MLGRRESAKLRKPHVPPPPLPRGELVYNVERRFIDLDQDGQCVVMDVWLERFPGMPDLVSRNFERRWYRFNGKKWKGFSAYPLEYFPYSVRSIIGQTLFIQAALEADVGDSMVLRRQNLDLLILTKNPGRNGFSREDGNYLVRHDDTDRSDIPGV